jgi:azurin
MSNAELAAAPGSPAVHAAQVERAGLDAGTRESALSALAQLNGTTREVELAAALLRFDERYQDPGTGGELGRLLASSAAADLRKAEGLIARMASKDHTLGSVRRAGLAAKAVMEGSPAGVWRQTESSTDGRTLLIDALYLIGDPALRLQFQPLVAGLLAPGAPAPASNVRTAALRVLPILGEENASAHALLIAPYVLQESDRVIATRALLQLPRSAWSGLDAAALSRGILAQATQTAAGERSQQDFVEFTRLGQELAGLLPAKDAAPLRRAFRELGVSVFVVTSVREQMRYDTTQIVVQAGKPFEIIFENIDVMPHNLVVVKPGTREAIGNAANFMPPTPDRLGRAYVPASDNVIAATKMLEPGQKQKLFIQAPRTPGNYEFVCTFPGHWLIMWGTLVVAEDPEAWLQQHAAETPAAPAAGGHGGHGKDHAHAP